MTVTTRSRCSPRSATRGPVHAVTLADGHDGWLVVGYDEARAALNDPRLSKDMQAALARRAARSSPRAFPGPAFARHMLVVDPPDHTRLRRLVAAAFTVRRVEALRPRVQAIVDDLLDAIAARARTARVDLVASFAFPLPFTVICELLGVPEADRAASGEGSRRCSPDVDATTSTHARRRRRTRSWRCSTRSSTRKQRAPGDDLVSALIARPRRRRAPHPARAAVDDLPADRRRPRHDHEPDRQRRRRPAAASRAARAAARRARPARRRPSRSCSATTRPSRTRPSATRSSPSRSAARRSRPARRSSSIWRPRTATPTATTTPDALDIDRPDVRHLAFGHGIHFCLGAPLARMEGQLALGSLLRRFPELRLAVPSRTCTGATATASCSRSLRAARHPRPSRARRAATTWSRNDQ